MKYLIIIITLFIVGCGGNWSKVGGDQNQFRKDKFQCQAECTPVAKSFGTSINPIILLDCMNECMEIKGWAKR
jgi:hypothetical protein